MSTASFENWAGNILDIGPMYPFVGTEVLLWIVGLALWIIWHIMQTKMENQTYQDELKRYGSREELKKIVDAESPENP